MSVNVTKKSLLIYAHYYIPDTASTGQILSELAEGLLAQFDVTVICVVPSYLGTVKNEYKQKKIYRESLNGVKVIRIRVPEFTKTNKLSRIKNILSYFFNAMSATFKVGKMDYVLAVSQPPILGGLLGVWGKWITHARFWNPQYYRKEFIQFGNRKDTEEAVTKKSCYIYWIQDANPEQIMAVGYFKFKPFLWLSKMLDIFSCLHADFVVVPARDMIETIEKRFTKHPKKMPKINVINNWIDEEKIHPLEPMHPSVVKFKKKYGLENKFIISYSGNLGQYYDLPNILKVIEKFPTGTKTSDGKDVIFIFIGNGTQKANMENYVREHHMDNVRFIPYQNKDDLIYSLNAADVHWCVNAKGMKGVSCPSKYYGIAAVGKPVLGVLSEGSEIRTVIEKCGSGLCCKPEDYKGIEKNIKWFLDNAGNDNIRKMGEKGRTYLKANLSKDKGIERFIEILVEI